MKVVRKIITLGCLALIQLIASTTSIAQEGGIGNNDVIANGNQNRIITKSSKSNSKPTTKDTTIKIRDVKYYLEPAKYDVKYTAQPIKPAKLKVVEPLEKLYAGYVKFGVGNYTMPYLDAYYNSRRSKKNNWGINLKHHSATGQINDFGNTSFSQNNLGGYYTHFLKNHTLKTNAYYKRNVTNMYGFNSNDTLIPQTYRESKDSINLKYNLVGIHSLLTSRYRDSSKIGHKVGLGYYFMNNQKGVQENNVRVYTTLSKYLKEENIEANVDFEIDFNNLKQPSLYPIDTTSVAINNLSTTTNTGILKLVPYVVSNNILNKLHFKGGFGVNIDIASVNKFYFFPEVELSYNLFNNVFIPYAGATGGVHRNSFNSTRIKNPWVLSNTVMKNTVEKYNIYGGIRGAISSEWSFNLTARTQKLENQAFYFNDTTFSYQNGFGILYDTINKTTFSGQLSYQKDEKFFFNGKAEYFMYKTKNQEFAWLNPDFKISLNATYDLANKIIVKVNIFIIGNRKSFSLDSIADAETTDAGQYVLDLKPYVDANLGLEYRYNKRLSIFINFNNLSAAKYQEFTKYPVHRFNALGGFTFRF